MLLLRRSTRAPKLPFAGDLVHERHAKLRIAGKLEGQAIPERRRGLEREAVHQERPDFTRDTVPPLLCRHFRGAMPPRHRRREKPLVDVGTGADSMHPGGGKTVKQG